MIVAAVILGSLPALTGCSSTPVSRVSALDARIDWPCDRLVVEWAVATELLEQVLDPSLELRQADGMGRLQLEVMHCKPRIPAGEDQENLAYANIVVPVMERSAPIALTRVSSAGWFYLQQAAASGPARSLMEEFGYPVTAAAQGFSITESGRRLRVEAELQFGAGRISIEALTDGRPSSWSRSSAYIGSGAGYVSAFFGEEASDRYSASAIVRFEGRTPLSGFGLTASPYAASLDRGLTSDRVYWRLPTG